MSVANDVTGGGSARECANNHFAEAAPHPTGLRPATLPTRGRDESARCGYVRIQMTSLAATASRSRRVFRARFYRFVPPSSSEGAGNAGRPMRPIAACAEVVVAGTRVVRSHRQTPGIPRAMVYGLCRTLPGDRAFLSPSPLRSLLLTRLTPASRRQDHTILPSASRAVRQRHISVHRIPSRIRDDRETPLRVGRDGGGYEGDLRKP